VTNEELDRARVDEAIRTGNGIVGSVALIAARLAREGWTPPQVADPDLLELETLWLKYTDGKINSLSDVVLAGIKRGRELERAEAQPGMVWVKHDGSDVCPVKGDTWVWSKGGGSGGGWGVSPDQACDLAWRNVTHYAIISQPENAA